MHKCLRAKVTLCANVSSCNFIPSCKIIFVQFCALLQFCPLVHFVHSCKFDIYPQQGYLKITNFTHSNQLIATVLQHTQIYLEQFGVFKKTKACLSFFFACLMLFQIFFKCRVLFHENYVFMESFCCYFANFTCLSYLCQYFFQIMLIIVIFQLAHKLRLTKASLMCLWPVFDQSDLNFRNCLRQKIQAK